jgi:hypothetical protein
MLKQKAVPVVLALAVSLLTGCMVIGLGVGVVGLAGYGVYKTGETVVTGVGKAGKATGSVIFFNGDFKTQYDGDVRTVWTASGRAFQKAGFGEIRGSFDALSGGLTAKTREGTEISLKLKSISPQSTEISIRVGVTGNLKVSETVHGLILQELHIATPQPQPVTNSSSEVK